jgi:hypothetical protein
MSEFKLVKELGLPIESIDGVHKYILAADLEALLEKSRFRYHPDSRTIFNLKCHPSRECFLLGDRPINKDTAESLLRELLAIDGGAYICTGRDSEWMNRARQVLASRQGSGGEK